ncbi:MAG: zinc ribbon domain-containing protein [Acidobacteriaceae bacterium]|nr:zinc ribbon domain-containing protein [Acidobacteriaceae bacterium]
MPDFCTCGAQLPPEARFCHKCGKPQFEPLKIEEEDANDSVQLVPPPLPSLPAEISFGNGAAVRAGFVAALFAVLLVVLLSSLPLPFLRLTIAFLAAGFLAVYLYTRRTGQPLTLRGGARMGWITGIFSFTIFTVQLTAGVLLTSNEGGLATVLKQQFPPNDVRTKQVLDLLQEPSALAVLMLTVLIFLFILLTLLPTLGALLGAKLLAREQ